MHPPPVKKLSRRQFLKAGAAGLTGMAVASRAAKLFASTTPIAPGKDLASLPSSGTMRYRTLGRTGLSVSEIGFGGYALTNPDVVRYALDKGINYFDTSHCYPSASEEALGKGLRGRRDKAIITTKWCPYHSGQPDKKEFFLAQLDESLRRLQTDHVDCLLTHQVGINSDKVGVQRLHNPELWEACEIARKAGKARFFGCSGHDGDLMEVMHYAVDCGKCDVILCRYSFMDYASMPQLIQKAQDRGVGFIAMKTLAGAKGADLNAFRAQTTNFKQAALQWVLSNPLVSNLIITISSFAQVDEYIPASGRELSLEDHAVLTEYAGLFSQEVCRFCNVCEKACPHDVPVADILRYSMYYHDYREQGRGLRSYATISTARNAGRCTDCSGPCAQKCPWGLPIQALLGKAHKSLV